MMRSLFALAATLFLSTAALGTSELVGAESCRVCHLEAYKAWSASAHARAHLSLDAAQRKNALCLQCHSRDEQRTAQAQVVGVSCETCHGPGRSYSPAVVMRDKELARLFGLQDVSAAMCLTCHNADSPSLQKFDLKEAMARIDHWTAERAARKGGKTAARAQEPRAILSQWLRSAP
jgi:hypothetical protein